MSEVFLTDSQAVGLNGAIGDSGLQHMTIGEIPHYASKLKQEAWLDKLLAGTIAALQVYKDGDLTFGVRPGLFNDGDTTRSYTGAAEQALTDDATNYIYILADGTLTVNTSGFPVPSATAHIPLATIATGSASAATTSGQYAIADITDHRARAIYSVLGS